ncbi:hypothetical protein CDES_14020 [Corynebacterium deserti GIMN1.010]|uniref:Nudix hydrolase domain-containing protein n=1 Tax=Corynebacterium deserti GIMN1.010 TaxID=931089 RepID=A0A0M3QAA6_9CORY|nr:NUDIX domain-containing protein [Corynebacterium deserti]ALC07129.1 hypothetical protein CDES_14020 [Corynebacterium deserti GIMN1.010]
MSDLKPEETTSGAPKRRRRRRSRRPSGQGKPQAQQQNQEQAGDSTTKQESKAESKTESRQNNSVSNSGQQSQKPKRRRSRRRRGNSGSAGNAGNSSNSTKGNNAQSTQEHQSAQKTAQKGPQKQSNSADRGDRADKGRGKGRKSPTRRRSNTRVHQAGQQSRMVTSDETSAGGLVVSGLAESVNDLGEVDLSKIYVALIGRLDRRGRLLWSMPKGHVEPGEGKAATAEREVWEETGIHGEVFTELGVIDYWFVSEGKRIHKTVHHHLLRFVDGDLNDEDPEVTEVAWIPANQLIEHLAFADERKLARKAHDLLPEFALKEKAEGRATPR